ncbi:MAG: DnaA regulatory inactivator Hda [Tepidimonas sp.]|nr:DnaA regulatory inactivator Hda [Tepidimonas sp.]
MRQLTLDLGLAPLPTLEAFCADGNEAALAALRQWLQERPAAPLYLWGPSGCGKTHLLQAAAHALAEGGQRCGWLDPDTAAHPFDDGWSAVLLDDVQRLDEVRQAVAFNWLVNAQSPACGAPRPVLAAGDRPPADLPLREDLRSRLAWGPVQALQPLSEAACRAVLQRTAQARGFALPDDVLDYVLARFARDLGSLMALLQQLDDYALRTQRAITVPLVRAMLVEA